MRKILAALLTAALALSLTACSALELLPDEFWEIMPYDSSGDNSKDEPDREPDFVIPSLPNAADIDFVIPLEEDFEFIDAGASGGFWKCYSCKRNIEIPSEIGGAALTVLSDNMFVDSYELVIVKIPDGVEKIGRHTFYGCRNLEGVFIPEGVTEIGSHAFCGCESLEGIVLPESLTKIGGDVFRDCTSLKSVVFPKSVTDIGGVTGGMFYNCTSLLNVDLGGTEYVGTDYFKNCGELRLVYLSDNIKSINRSAFKDCPNVKVVYKGKSYSGEKLEKLIKQMNDEYYKKYENGGDPFGR